MLKYVFDFSKDNTKDIIIAANNDCKNVVLSNFFFIPVGYYFLISEWGRKKHEAWRPVYIAEKRFTYTESIATDFTTLQNVKNAHKWRDNKHAINLNSFVLYQKSPNIYNFYEFLKINDPLYQLLVTYIFIISN